MPSLTLDQILQSNDREPHRVEMPEWGGAVYVRDIGGEGRDELESWRTENPNLVGFRAKVVSLGLCSEDGEALGFTAAKVSDLSEKSGAALDRLTIRIYELSGYLSAEVEELEKNY